MEQVQFAQLAINTISGKTDNVYEDIFILPKERRGFAFNQRLMVTPIFFYRIIGIEDKNTYEQKLLELHSKLKELGDIYLKIDRGLDKFIDSGFIQKTNHYWSNAEKTGLSSAKIIVESTLKRDVISSINLVKDQLIKDKLTILLDIFMRNQSNMNIVKNFYIKFLYWTQKYAIKLLKAYEYGNTNPKVLFYGDIQRDEVYFLIFLSLLGFDVLYFHTNDGSRFNEIEGIDVYSNLVEYPHRESLRPFPNAPRALRRETVAYRASREIDQVLHTEDSGVYRPWQFEDYEVVSRPLRTTHEELFILWKEEARFREGFKVEDGRVYIPNIFAKISGTTIDLNEYWDNFEKLMAKEDTTILIEKIPFNRPRGFAVTQGVFNLDGSLNKEKVKSIREYRFGYLRTSVQNLILDKIDELVVTTDLFTFQITNDFKTKALYTILGLDKIYLDLLQKFDYPLQIPKLVIFDGNESIFSDEDIIIIAFLHLVGFDIVILTPTGYNNIENGIDKYYYDIHKLEDFKFDLRPQRNKQEEKKSTLKKGFFWFFQ
ncbi:YceG family protein [Alkaliphilus sp. MSJ-5]|uniref:YceG family protein n=1 Tax=Alkaliphilus flagellatus TaxID=2841507 RepID=A0ABS6FYA3_9FIRM|nr:YceG family protein [Alkaliphilus flagellatus]MBU5675218.1 YceG family protein [Alkaliphilus flagellatus]